MRVWLSYLMFVGAMAAATEARGENWAEWRGPRRNAVSAETGLPMVWTATEGVRWQARLPGRGTSSPIIWDDHVIVTAADGPRQSDLHVINLSARDGRQRWHTRLWGTSPTLHHGTKSDMATPTPVTDGEAVFAFFGTGDVFALDMKGRLLWQRSLASEYGAFENRFGHTSSPLLVADLLILQCDHYGDSYLLALDKHTGQNRWKLDRTGTWHSWSSPRLVETAEGRVELVVCAAHRIDALDPTNAQPLWTVGGLQRECIPTPVAHAGVLYAVSGPKGQTLAIRSGGSGDVGESHVVWRSPRGSPFVPSAILVDDHYYLVDDAGIATCLDARSGKQLWQKRLRGGYTASPIAGDGKLYFTNEDGETTVLRAGVERYEELARNPLGEPVYASGAISQGCVFLRTFERLVCIGAGPKSDP